MLIQINIKVMARFSVKGATELVKTSVQLMSEVRPMVSNRDIDGYKDACVSVLLLKYNDTKALRSFINDLGQDGLGCVIMNTYNNEMRANEILADYKKFRQESVEEWFNRESGL